MNEEKVQGELLRGNIDTIILKCLFNGEKYGNEIMKDIEDRTRGQFIIKQPTLYSALTRLENQGLVNCTWVSTNNGGRRKYFAMTEAGREFFSEKQREWEFSRTVVDKLISEKIFESDAIAAPAAVHADEIRISEINPSLSGAETAGTVQTSPPDRNGIRINEIEPDIQALQDVVSETASAGALPESLCRKNDANRPADGIVNDQSENIIFEETDLVKNPDGTVPDDVTQRLAGYTARYGSYAASLADQASVPESDSAPEPPQFVTFESDSARTTETPPDSTRTVEEENARREARRMLYSTEPSVNPIEDARAVREAEGIPNTDDYRAVLSGLYSESSASPEEFLPAVAETLPAADRANETLPNGIVIRRHNSDLSKEYNAKYYVYANKMRLIQYVVLAVVMLIETLALYLGLVVGAHITADLWLYYTALALALAFPVLGAAVCFTKPDETQRIAEESKNTILYRFLIILECVVLIVCINILVDKNVLTTSAFLTRLVLPCVLSTNFVVNTLIYRMLAKSGRYAVKS